ncbi:MAG: beta-ketoacyl-[acyl-carrier-protein] synthase family protein [Gammaproteobacteria bacterium]|nr:beta-ketoacyl-[acyl-carrier-protein] synthase family protein [Gammaproteobacteria bacterium]
MPETTMKRRIVITGYGTINPLGKNARDTFERASKGESGIDFIKAFDTTGLPCQVGGEVNEAWLEDLEQLDLYRESRLDKFTSRAVKLMTLATHEAAEMASLDQVVDRRRVGFALGSHGENPTIDEMKFLHRFYSKENGWDIQALESAGGYSFMSLLQRKPDVAPAVLARLFRCESSSVSVVSACAAGAQAIGEAYRLIQDDKCDLMIAGGCEATLNFSGFIGFVLIKAMAEKYGTPQTASRPFDRKRNGFVMSEGAGAVILEELEHARERGATILGELKGYGDSADAYRITDTHPKGEGAMLAMQKAIADAGLEPGDIDYVNAHGTSTTQNDLVESRAIETVFGEHSTTIPVSSNKSMLGHTIAAAGAIEFIMTLMGINNSLLLPTINHEFKDKKCRLDYVPNEAREQHQNNALSNSFGFGGQNASLCIGRFEP